MGVILEMACTRSTSSPETLLRAKLAEAYRVAKVQHSVYAPASVKEVVGRTVSLGVSLYVRTSVASRAAVPEMRF